MANIKTPDGGFYVDDTEFNVDYVNNIVTLANGGGGVAGVSSFNGRNGAVVPQDGDYTAEQVGAVSLSGGTITGALNMGNNKITMGATPTETTDVTNKGYVDGVVKVVSDEVDGIIAGTTPISVPIATNAKVGGVKVGAGLSVDGEGTLSTEQTYLSTQGGTMDANAVINGTDSLEISVGDASQSAVVGVTQNGVTIEHNTNSDADSSIKAIDNAIEIKANNTTVTVNGTGVALGGAAISGVNSLAGQPSTEIAIESDIDMNSHNLTNISTGGINIITDETNGTVIQANNNIALGLKNAMDKVIGIGPDVALLRCADAQIVAEPDNISMGVSNGPGSNTGVIAVDSIGNINLVNSNDAIIRFESSQPINFNNNRLTGVANPTNGSDAVNLTYFQSNVPTAPEMATTSVAGLVKQFNYISSLSPQATLTDVIDAFNQLLGRLQIAGIMAGVE